MVGDDWARLEADAPCAKWQTCGMWARRVLCSPLILIVAWGIASPAGAYVPVRQQRLSYISFAPRAVALAADERMRLNIELGTHVPSCAVEEAVFVIPTRPEEGPREVQAMLAWQRMVYLRELLISIKLLPTNVVPVLDWRQAVGRSLPTTIEFLYCSG